MIAFSPEAEAHIAGLEWFYVEREWAQALRNLGYVLAAASLVIMNAPKRGLPAPRPYPELAALNLSWPKRGRCQKLVWIFLLLRLTIRYGSADLKPH